jgi:hypothetical protein
VRGKHNKLGEGERKVWLGQDSLPNSHFRSGNERKLYTLFYPDPFQAQPSQAVDEALGWQNDTSDSSTKLSDLIISKLSSPAEFLALIPIDILPDRRVRALLARALVLARAPVRSLAPDPSLAPSPDPSLDPSLAPSLDPSLAPSLVPSPAPSLDLRLRLRPLKPEPKPELEPSPDRNRETNRKPEAGVCPKSYLYWQNSG